MATTHAAAATGPAAAPIQRVRIMRPVMPAAGAERSFEAGLFLLADIGRKGLAGLDHSDLLQRAAMLVAVAQRAHLDHDAVTRLHRGPRPSSGTHQIARDG